MKRQLSRGRRSPVVRLACEVLEGRALLAAGVLDPSFGTGGLVLGPISAGPGGSDEGSAVVALAVQTDGRIVTAETGQPIAPTGSGPTTTPLTIHRYNSNGTVDPTFGTNGATLLPNPTTNSLSLQAKPQSLTIASDGSIAVIAQVPTTATPYAADVYRLTSAGQLDTRFGGTGMVALPTTIVGANSVAVESSGRLVIAGFQVGLNSNANGTAVVIGLTSTGALDSTFGADGQTVVPLLRPLSNLDSAFGLNTVITGLQLTPTGQILLSVGERVDNFDTGFVQTSGLTRLSASGVIDTTFGNAGTLDLSSVLYTRALVVQADGRIVLAGSTVSGNASEVVRLLASGAVDPTYVAVPAYTGDNFFQAVAVGADGEVTAATVQSSIYRYGSNGAPDTSFGTGGRFDIQIPTTSLPPNGQAPYNQFDYAVGLSSTGRVLIGGTIDGVFPQATTPYPSFSQSLLAQIIPGTVPEVINDYSGKGHSDFAVELTQYGAFAVRSGFGSNNGSFADTVQTFGPTGAGQSIPAPGDYDGDGRSDPALYLPALGVLAYRPSGGGPDVLTRFGPTGLGNAVPAPGDYDGDGKTDVALFLPGSATFIVDPSGGGAPYAVQFGSPGSGNSIPAPGDYDGSGKTEFAVYLPTVGVFVYRSAISNTDVAVPFGLAGAGQTLPAPGDYNGDGKTDVAAFLPALGLYAYRPSGGGPDVLTRFGPTGLGNAVPVPGDYDGDGKTDVALFLPGSSTFAIDPSGRAVAFAEQFGAAGVGNSVPATASVVPVPQVSAASWAGGVSTDAGAWVPVYLPDDLIGAVAATRKKPIG